MTNCEYNTFHGDIRMKKIELAEAESILKKYHYKWIYIKLICDIYDDIEDYQTVLYTKFKVSNLIIDDNNILIYGTEDKDRFVISKDILVQSECTPDYDELRFIQKSDKTIIKIYIMGYLPTARFRLDEITHSNKNKIITEGKTDWKHLKNALTEFKKENKYINLDFEFFEYEDDIKMGNLMLLNICKYQAIFRNEYLKVFIFDSDDPVINKEHEGSEFKYYGNNVYSLILPTPSHRVETPLISIENYYLDNEIRFEDEYGRRLYLAKEFNKETGQHIAMSNVYTLNVNNDTTDNHIIDDKVYIIDSTSPILKKDIYSYHNKTNIALSKNNFSQFILNKVEPFDKIKIDSFNLVFSILSKIQNDSIRKKDYFEEISKRVFLKKYEDKGVLQIDVILNMERAEILKNARYFQIKPTVSEDKTTLNLQIYTGSSEIKIPITINFELIDFLESKLSNWSNRIELHIFNENNEFIGIKEVFKGDNSSVGITLILSKIFS